MHCEIANPQLTEYAEGMLSAADHAGVEAHLNSCEQCQQDYAAIVEWRTMAGNWHDEVPPAWEIPKLDRPSYLVQFADSFRQWFPTFASATALVLVTVMYTQGGSDTQSGFVANQQVADYSELPQLPQATQAAFNDALETNREQRKQELQTLLGILTAEMNRRSIETEESLRFLVSSQLQGQQELDQLYQQVEKLIDEPQGGAQPGNPGYDQLFEGVSQ